MISQKGDEGGLFLPNQLVFLLVVVLLVITIIRFGKLYRQNMQFV